ncbi:serine/threonine-protein kinase [Nannocystis radixulma]|uniref:Serine/threonine-protein kinase n=1 Tax=Nannocystis radixulma TaxID=2995305 RepID=A0ABT5B636_9BACT|nr:serine/threonine-protein kinase [Nannocystis radixulma]MDC0669583.1 serine/threonine-protein kinase [Nannocystis radixulma]
MEEGTPPVHDELTLCEQPPTRGGERHEPGPLQIGRYLVVRKLGQGGMAIVYAAYDPQLDRRVAIKLLRSGIKGRSLSVGQARLQREAQTLARLSHPNVVQVYEVGRYGDDVFIAMEFVAGKTLRTWLKSHAPTWRDVVRVFRQAGEGLAAAHAYGIVHRDFKPENVLVGDDGRVRVVDFGLARLEEPDAEAQEHPSLGDLGVTESPLTRAGVLVGTPAYMAPEQFLRMALTTRTDQFSFCVALHEALYGARPFDGSDVDTIRENVLLGRGREPPARHAVPAWVRRIVGRGLQVAADDRFPDMRALLDALARDPAVQRRRWAIAGAVVLALCGLVGLYTRVLALQTARCTGAEANLAGIWDEPRQRQIEQALLATGASYAPATWAAIERRLDAYAAEWARRTEAACAATHVRGETSAERLDQRHACLNSRLVELRALSEVLAHASATTVERAVAAADALPPLAPCDDDRYLDARVKPPTAPNLALMVAAVREQLAHGKALLDAGDIAGSERTTWAAARAAEALDYPPLWAEAQHRRGVVRREQADFRGAATDLTEAYHLASELGDDDLVFQAGIDLAHTSLTSHGFAEAAGWARHAEDALRRTGSDPALETRLMRARAAIRAAEGHADLAEPLLTEAIAQVERLGEPELGELASLESELGHCLYKLGRHDDALVHLERARELLVTLVGADHPRYAAALNVRAAVFVSLARHDAAHALYEEVLAINQRAYGEHHPTVARTLNNIGYVLLAQHRVDEAAQRFARAYTVLEHVHGDDHPQLVIALTNLASVAAELGDFETAIARYLRAESIVERHLGGDHPDLAAIVNGLGVLYMRQGRLADAEPLLLRALANTERARGSDDLLRAEGLTRLGELRARQGRHGESLILHQRALALLARSLPPDHVYLGSSLLGVGAAQVELGEPLVALASLERALRLLLLDTTARSSDVAMARFTLARALVAAGQEPERARELARTARELLAADPLESARVAAIDAWLRSPQRDR